MDEPGGHYVEWHKPGPAGQRLHDSTHMRNITYSNSKGARETTTVAGRWEGGSGELCNGQKVSVTLDECILERSAIQHSVCQFSHSVVFSHSVMSHVCDLMDCSMPGIPVLHIPQSLLKLMSIESRMPSSHLILCRSIILVPSNFPSIGVFFPMTKP